MPFILSSRIWGHWPQAVAQMNRHAWQSYRRVGTRPTRLGSQWVTHGVIPSSTGTPASSSLKCLHGSSPGPFETLFQNLRCTSPHASSSHPIHIISTSSVIWIHLLKVFWHEYGWPQRVANWKKAQRYILYFEGIHKLSWRCRFIYSWRMHASSERMLGWEGRVCFIIPLNLSNSWLCTSVSDLINVAGSTAISLRMPWGIRMGDFCHRDVGHGRVSEFLHDDISDMVGCGTKTSERR